MEVVCGEIELEWWLDVDGSGHNVHLKILKTNKQTSRIG